MNPVNASIGATVAGVVLLLVMVPILDNLTQETMRGDDLNEGESYYYCPHEVFEERKATCNLTYTNAPVNGIQSISWKVDDEIITKSYPVPDAGLVVFYGENGFIASQDRPNFRDDVSTPEIYDRLCFYSYETKKFSEINSSLRVVLENGEYILRTNPITNLGSWCYALCPEEVAELVGGTKMVLQEGETATCFQYAAIEKTYGIGVYPTMARYDIPADMDPGTYNALDLDDTMVLSFGNIQNGVERFNEVQNGNASFTVSQAAHNEIIELNGFDGEYYSNNYGNLIRSGNLYGGTHMVIVPYEQTWTSEYRDIVMVIPVLVAIAILMNVGMMIYNNRRD